MIGMGVRPRSPEYAGVQDRLARGWNTWDTRSVLTQVRLPDGLAISLAVKEYYRGLTLRTVQIGRTGEFEERVTFGPHALDGRFTDVTVRWLGITLRVRTAHDGDDLVALVEPLETQTAAATLAVTAFHAWARPGVVVREGERLVATSAAGETTVRVIGETVEDPYVDVDGPRLLVRLDQPVGVVTGRERSIDEIRDIVEAAEGALAEDVTDEHDEIVRDAVAWNTLYEPKRERVVTTVSRLWNVVKRGGFAMFCWDAFFGALLAGTRSSDLAVANVLEMLAETTPEGFVPNVVQGTGRVTYDGSQPPFASLITWELAHALEVPWLMRDAFPALLSWNRWWWRVRRNGDLISGGSTYFEPEVPSPQDVPRIHQHFGATCESGADDHPVFADVPFDTDTSLLRAHDIGLNSEYVLDCEYLARIADVLGEAEAAEELRERGAGVAERMRERMWDDDRGIYRSVFSDTGGFTAYESSMNFFPLFAGLADADRAERMMQDLWDPQRFGGEWVVPVSPRDDPRSEKQSYWYGRAWPPINFLIYLGLARAGRVADRERMAERSSALVLHEWRTHRHIHENYSSETGEGCDVANSEPFLTWGGLLSLVALLEQGRVPYFREWLTPSSTDPFAHQRPKASTEGAQQ